MFSKTLYNTLALLLNVSKFFNVSTIRFHESNRILWCDRSPQAARKVLSKFIMVSFLFIGWIFHTYNLYKLQKLDEMNQILAFQFGALLFCLNYSISVLFPIDICRIFNGLILYFRHLHSK